MLTQRQFRDIARAVQDGRTGLLPIRAGGIRYLRRFLPRERLILLGGGHIAVPLCRLGAMLGFSVVVVDDRPEYAVRSRFPEAEQVICADFKAEIGDLRIGPTDYVAIITHGHRWDADCLRTLLSGVFPRYLGMISSRRRAEGLSALLIREGFSPDLIGRVRSPIGLSIGALTPQEIAVSIAGELIQCRRAKEERSDAGQILITGETDPALLDLLARDRTPKAVIVVIASEGSTPAKPGALMTVDRDGRAMGTIGGGSGEHLAVKRALALIGSGRDTYVTLDMNDELLQGEMACGGRLSLYLSDLILEETEHE